ncbi:MAG TPA: hypothetical protein VEU72_09310 [Nitrosopumilaceae archaeon]|nr:hypothetical protein [Nitrosopumilaceae archaeon]
MISSLNLAKVLGHGNPPALIISSVIFGATLFFYIFSVGSYFQVGIAPLENRFNYHEPFLIHILDKHVDQLIIVCGTASWLALSLLKKPKIFIPIIYVGSTAIAALGGNITFDAAILFSFPIILSFLIYNRFATVKILSYSTNLNLNYLAILFTALATVSLIVSVIQLFSFQSNKIIVKDYAYDIFLLFGSFSSLLIFLLITGSSVKLLVGKSLIKMFKTDENSFFSDSNKKSRNKIPYLLLIILFSVALSLVPHYPAINNNNQQVGADSAYYVIFLRNLMDSKDPSGFIHQAFVGISGGDRPITLIFLYGLAKMIPGDLSVTVDHLPMILVPMLVLSIFLLTRELTSNDNMSLFAAFLTAVSAQTLIGIYAGYYANLFALVIGYLSFVFLIRFLKKSGKLNLVAYISLMIALVFSHIHTWTVLTAVMSVFLILMYKLHHYDKKRVALVFLVVLLTVAIDVSRTVITNVHGAISQDVTLASQGAGIPQLILSWSTLNDTMQNFAGGQFGNFIILILGLYWLVRSNLREPPNILLALFLAIGILPLLFGNDLIQSRVFYDIPFQIPAAIALFYLSRRINLLMALPICIWVVAISLRMVTNFYFVSPS